MVRDVVESSGVPVDWLQLSSVTETQLKTAKTSGDHESHNLTSERRRVKPTLQDPSPLTETGKWSRNSLTDFN